MKIIGIIPSRYNSTRFPGKPLVNIDGKIMIHRVYEQAKKAKALDDVIVATDDERIFKAVKEFGGHAVMTDAKHKNGTERCNEVAAKIDADVIINIQGDEPFIQPGQIELIANCFNTSESTQIATLIKEQLLNEELQNPERVKVVLNKNMEALYFSRSIIPFLRKSVEFTVHGFGNENAHAQQEHASNQHIKFYKHIGIYGYRKDVLAELVKLPHSPLELAENLEQLRWLENGYKIKCAITEFDSVCIDTPEDLTAVK
jgi:3-deoxy-manno-octulosonate cytidylyltransferase (CMP-KDO synthetase)